MKEQWRLAFVDDDRVLRESLGASLSRFVEHVEVFETPQEVIDRFTAEDRPEVLFTDGHMPEMSGLRLAGIIRERYPTTTIVLVSGGVPGANLGDPNELREFGIDLFIPKREFETRAAVEAVKRLRSPQV